jgi:hypothetical protein
VVAQQPSKQVTLRLMQDLQQQEGTLPSVVANSWAKVLQVLSVSQVVMGLVPAAQHV